MLKQSAKISLNSSFNFSLKSHKKKGNNSLAQSQYREHKSGNKDLKVNNTSENSILQKNIKKSTRKVAKSHKKENSASKFKSQNKKHTKIQPQLSKMVDKQLLLKCPRSSIKQGKQRAYSSMTSQFRPQAFARIGIRKNKPLQELSFHNDQRKQLSNCQSTHQSTIQQKKYEKKIQKLKQFELKQDHIKTDFEQRKEKVYDQKNVSNKYLNQADQQKNNMNQIQNSTISQQDIQKINEIQSKQISELQSRSETIDLLKCTIKTKLSKDIFSESPSFINPLLYSSTKGTQQKFVEQILRVKELESNFYIDKITQLQNQLNKCRKERQSIEEQVAVKCKEENRKNLYEKIRFQEENQLLKRQNEALRAIILKKIIKSCRQI